MRIHSIAAFAGDLTPLLVELFVKGSVILLVAAVAVLALRRSSAARRHLVWSVIDSRPRRGHASLRCSSRLAYRGSTAHGAAAHDAPSPIATRQGHIGGGW